MRNAFVDVRTMTISLSSESRVVADFAFFATRTSRNARVVSRVRVVVATMSFAFVTSSFTSLLIVFAFIFITSFRLSFHTRDCVCMLLRRANA